MAAIISASYAVIMQKYELSVGVSGEEKERFYSMTNDEYVYETCLLLVKHFRNSLMESRPVHSRIFEHILHPEINYVLVGESEAVRLGGEKHPEHVVPCATLMTECRRLIKENWFDEDIAKLLQKHWKIVHISKDEANYLDSKDGLNLKWNMPSEWRFENGDTFERLRRAENNQRLSGGWDKTL